MPSFFGAAQAATRNHTPRNMMHVVAIHLAMAAHQGQRCSWCRQGLVKNLEKDGWETCPACHGFGNQEKV